MKKQLSLTLMPLLVGLAFYGCNSAKESTDRVVSDEGVPSTQLAVDDDDDDGDQMLSLAMIPAAVTAAAEAAVPGLLITEAELESGGTVYCVHGTVDGRFTEVEVGTDGTILEIEYDDDDEDGDDDDDDDDDDR